MDEFIIRIYRDRSANPDDVLGVLERIGRGDRQTFRSAQELWRLLVARPPGLGGKARSEPR